MSEIDLIDEAQIEADPATIRAALIDEAMGKTYWWRPHWEARQRGGIPPDQVGGMIDVTVHSAITVRFTARTAEIAPNLWRVEYVQGDYRGQGTWNLAPVDGRTRVRFCWQVQPTGWLKWLLRIVPPSKTSKGHRAVMRAGFHGLSNHIKQLSADRV